MVSYLTLPFCLFLLLSPYVYSQMYPFPYGQQLDYNFYDRTCPRLPMIVKYNVWAAVKNDTRMAASLLRMHFHDCIVDVRQSLIPVLIFVSFAIISVHTS